MFNLKELNKVVPYAHFKMEVLFLLKEMPLPEDFMCKTDLNNVYFAVSPSKKSQKYARSQWKSQLWKDQEFWSELMKVSISLRRKLSIRIIIYLDDMLNWTRQRQTPKETFKKTLKTESNDFPAKVTFSTSPISSLLMNYYSFWSFLLNEQMFCVAFYSSNHNNHFYISTNLLQPFVSMFLFFLKKRLTV